MTALILRLNANPTLVQVLGAVGMFIMGALLGYAIGLSYEMHYVEMQ
jgi:hypothetical protein